MSESIVRRLAAPEGAAAAVSHCPLLGYSNQPGRSSFPVQQLQPPYSPHSAATFMGGWLQLLFQACGSVPTAPVSGLCPSASVFRLLSGFFCHILFCP